MSLLTIAQNAADECGLKRPSTIIGNSGTTERRLLRFATRTCRDLVRESFPYLIKEATFSTVADQSSYSFSSDIGITDFDHFVPFTQWNRTTNRKAYQIDPQFWQELNSGLATVSINDRYRIRGADRDLHIFPTPSAVETIAFEYVSKNFCKSAGGTEQSSWQTDTDTGVLDEELIELGTIWRMLNRLGEPYAEEKAEYQRVKNKAKAQIGPRKIVISEHRDPISNLPDTSFGGI